MSVPSRDEGHPPGLDGSRSPVLPVAVLLLSMGACAALPIDEATAPPPQAGACHADGARSVMGLSPTRDVVELARVDSRSRTVRVIRPGDAVTQDYSGDRLNLEVNDRGAITGAYCG
ncbi:I78 family peptidase inhibitor [Montanilutibacter psychrotolerans]|nr:I78 family peptidase inhibitor [Lysobacter psychrotolerans]